jgi:hypothetical protein
VFAVVSRFKNAVSSVPANAQLTSIAQCAEKRELTKVTDVPGVLILHVVIVK